MFCGRDVLPTKCAIDHRIDPSRMCERARGDMDIPIYVPVARERETPI